MDVGEHILNATAIMVDDAVKKAQYNKTIEAQVLSCEDATIGKYRCRYQDAIIYAYSNSSDVTYNKGAYVYILIPNGDMSKDKTILGATKKLGINYISQAQGEEAYNIIGNNCVIKQEKYYLDTNNKNYKYTIYQAGDENNLFDVSALNQYIKNSSSVIIAATIKTSIPVDRQYQGHYGITYNLKFHDNVSNTEVIRPYTINEDNMIDNPYRLVYGTRQCQIFEIDGTNFIQVQSIQIFNSGFPGAEGIETGLLSSGDIEISNLELLGAVRLSGDEISGVAITFSTPQGTLFTNNSVKGDVITITAQVRVKGKLASAAQQIPFYWGRENIIIGANNPYYNKSLGQGWQCLNKNNVIDYQIEQIKTELLNQIEVKQQENKYYFRNFEVLVYNAEKDTYESATREDIQNKENNFYYANPTKFGWLPGTDTYYLKFEDATARDNRFKVAIIYDGITITKTIDIQNLADAPELTIESSDGTKFYYDIGHPTLTCKVNGEQDKSYIYNWAYEDNSGIFRELPETTQQNQNYNQALLKRDQIQYEISSGERFANASQKDLKNAQAAVDDFNLIQRVKSNKIYDVQIRCITSFGTFKCSVYNENGLYLGTASITLTNTLEGEDLYSLVINNGSVTFQYNANGIAPNNQSLVTQQQIQALTFTIYDNLGNPIDEDIVANNQNCKVRWSFPIKNTLLVDKQDSGESSGTDPTLTYRYYDNKTILLYDIAQKYNIKKQNNQIRLTVDYKGMNLTTQTQFNFIKQGEPGTNGTEYIVKLIPNVKNGQNIPLWPMITHTVGLDANGRNEDLYLLNYRLPNINKEEYPFIADRKESIIKTTNDYQLLKAQLWRDGELIWEGHSANESVNNLKPTLVRWEILRNQYSNGVYDNSVFEITDNLEGKIRYNVNNQTDIFEPSANIIKCSITWQGKTYYGTIPITTAETSNWNYRVSLKDYTGFRYVIYSSDGVLPQYDNSYPFEFICQEKINDIWEDISNIEGEHKVQYKVQSDKLPIIAIGTNQREDSNLLEILEDRIGCKDNQWWVRPASRYDGLSINNAICFTFKRKYKDLDGNEFYNNIGRINVPIHFLLNKYGLSHINEWDGNSVQVDQQGGFILSPQMGAGKKDENNNFTGVLMGTVQFPEKQTAQTGLLGFDRGDRTFLLNSQNGSAIFGKNNGGQIIIDPSIDKAMLYSGNFWNKYDNEIGLPSSYEYRDDKYRPSGNNAEKGMIIDLTTPEIYFGSGNFYVNSEGHIHAAGGGDIGGWVIDEHNLHSNIKENEGRITIDAGEYNDEENKVIGPGKIYSHNHASLSTADDGFYLSHDGLSIGSKVKIDSDGIMYLGSNAVKNGGVEGENLSRSYWTINGDDKKSYISYGGNSWSKANSDTGQTAKVYLGTDGISLGTRFSVSPRGELVAYSGEIGGWNITKETLTAGNIKLNSEGSMEGGTGGNKWSIGTNGSATFNNITANGTGYIGGWKIGSSSLSAGNITLYSSGTIEGDGWSINKNTFNIGQQKNVTVKIKLDGNSSLGTGAGTINNGSGYLGGSNSNSAPLVWSSKEGVTLNKGATLKDGVKIGKLIIGKSGELMTSGGNGFVYITTAEVKATNITATNFRVSDGDNDQRTGKTGKAVFSDGSYLEFKSGICIGYNIKNSG